MKKLVESKDILTQLQFEKEQTNDMSGYVLLALVQLTEEGPWSTLETPLIGIKRIVQFISDHYGKKYKENTRESVRKNVLHQFLEQGLIVQNPDDPQRPPNSPKWCYQVTPEGKYLLESYGSDEWGGRLDEYLRLKPSLVERNRKSREMLKTPIVLPSGLEVQLSQGEHNQLIGDILTLFHPRFARDSEVLYIGDTGNKTIVFEEDRLRELGVVLHERGKLPDVVLYLRSKNWLYLIESVTSVGPVDDKRYWELVGLFGETSSGLIFVTVFPDRKRFSQFVTSISWETEVWIREDPDHLIHFNGDRFLGPHRILGRESPLEEDSRGEPS